MHGADNILLSLLDWLCTDLSDIIEIQRNTQIFAGGIGGTLVLIFLLELSQMNINKWGDSWGAGCVIGAIGFTLRK